MPSSTSTPTPKTSVGTAIVDAVRYVGIVAIVGMAFATVFTMWTPNTQLGSLLAGFPNPAATPVSLVENTPVITPTVTAPCAPTA